MYCSNPSPYSNPLLTFINPERISVLPQQYFYYWVHNEQKNYSNTLYI